MKRSLSLSRETLSALTVDELGVVVGAADAITAQGNTCPVVECIGLRSWVGHCPTLPECP